MICSGPQNLAQELKAIGDQLQELQKKLIQGPNMLLWAGAVRMMSRAIP